MLEKYIFAGACGLRSPLFESSSVSYITPTCTSSMQEFMMQGMQQLFEKSCFRCEKYTWHVESNHILQNPIYLIVIARRFRLIGNNFAKCRCSSLVHMAVLLGPHKFSLQTTLNHHGPSMYFGHYTSSINCCQKIYCNHIKITEFQMTDIKTPFIAYVVKQKLITWCFLD